jgi:hypothetical protein
MFLYTRAPKHDKMFLVMSGAMAGLSAWTKNEGLAFFIFMIVARLLTIPLEKGSDEYIKEVRLLVAGFLPVILLVAFFKFFMAPSGDILSQGYASILGKLGNIERYGLVFKFFLLRIARFGMIHFAGMVPVLLSYLLIVGIKAETKDREPAVSSLLLLGFMLITYFFTYIASPHDPAWHMSRSLDRLLCQLWPSFVLVLFIFARPPDKT